MPQFAIKVFASPDPAIAANRPTRCSVNLNGLLNSIEVANVGADLPFVAGYFNLRELMGSEFPRVSTPVTAVAFGQEIEIDFFWGRGTPYRSLAQMYIDRPSPKDADFSRPLSKLHLKSWYIGPNPSEPARGAVLFESTSFPLHHSYQYLHLDPPSEKYQEVFKAVSHFVWQEAPITFHLSDRGAGATGTTGTS